MQCVRKPTAGRCITVFALVSGAEKIAQLSQEEKQIKEENLRLQRKLQMEVERREQLCRHLSESESSLEMDEERIFNEGHCVARGRAVSSPIPYAGPGQRYASQFESMFEPIEQSNENHSRTDGAIRRVLISTDPFLLRLGVCPRAPTIPEVLG